ncbi:HotDog domain-containing protein [Paraphysoderma sedebokerense]|nr:HotDog domain-containing protein [Paraphysoderma sedebokerense]
MSVSDRLDHTMEDSLRLEEIDVNLYRSDPKDLWRPFAGRGVFGGQIIGLSLVAATKTVEPEFIVHSLHSHFIMAGDESIPIIFSVNRKPEKSTLVHQYKMPLAPNPESLPSSEERLTDWISKVPKKFHKLIQLRMKDPIPVDIRPVEITQPEDLIKPKKKDPRQLVWMKSKSSLPNNPALHMCVAAYCSDHHLLWTTLLTHGISGISNPRLKMIASLDHSMWFHESFRADEWLLYEMESPRTGGNRGLALGRLWTRDGRLICSCAQEGVIRLDPRSPSYSPSKEFSASRSEKQQSESKL